MSEINTELTSIMRAINPDADKWRDEFFEEFKKGPEDEGYDEE